MPGSTATRDPRVGPRRQGAHGLLLADTDRERRVGAAAWVDRQLTTGAKVYYKGWLTEGDDPASHWLVRPGGAPAAREAAESGQLEILGFPEVIARCGGTTEGLHALLRGEVERAVRQGFARVAMSQESARRPMVDEAEAAEFAAQESAYDELARRWPLTTLCQLNVAEENPAATWESAALHHHQLLDPQWSATLSRRRWHLRGTLDAHVTERFGAALYGALREALASEQGPDLHVDLSGVEFADLAFAQTLFLTAHSVAAEQRVVLHGASAFLRRLFETIGRPRSVLLVTGGERRAVSAVARSADDAVPGLTHLGLLYDTPDDLVDLVVPHLGEALDRGDAVATLVDRRTTRALREALGEHRALSWASPHDVGTARPEVLLRRLRDVVVATPGRRSTILTQYSAFPTAHDDVAVGESGINLVLADLPLTMVCACPRDAGPSLLDAVRHGHPSWLDAAGAADNPGFRPPQDRTPTASTVWGGVHALRLRFGRTEDLARIRTHVAALAAEVGLRGEPAQCAVLAVHEAAVVACDDAADAHGCDDPCVLDAWTAGARLVVEIRGPRASTVRAGDDPGGDEARLPRNRLRVAGPLRVVRAFCRDLTTREGPDGRVVRVVS